MVSGAHGQTGFAYRFDWGVEGLAALAPAADVVVLVDVLRFTTAVTAALEAGSVVVPYPWDRSDAADAAAAHGAVLGGRREDGGPSLSPTDLLGLGPGRRVLLPSPNGAALACAAAELGVACVVAGCLRNASAVAQFVRRRVGPRATVAVIAAGERWPAPAGGSTNGPLRPCVEDLLGAGAVLAALDPSGAVANPCCSPEARAARAAFNDARARLYDTLAASASGRELVARGWDDDVATCSALDVAPFVGHLVDGAFVAG